MCIRVLWHFTRTMEPTRYQNNQKKVYDEYEN